MVVSGAVALQTRQAPPVAATHPLLLLCDVSGGVGCGWPGVRVAVPGLMNQQHIILYLMMILHEIPSVLKASPRLVTEPLPEGGDCSR